MPALRPAVAGFAVLSVLASAATIAQAASLASLLAAVMSGRSPSGRAAGYLLIVAAAMALRAAAAGASEWLGQHSSLRVQATLREHLLAAAARIGARDLSRNDRSRIAAASTSGIESLDAYVARAVPAVVAAVVSPPLILAAIGITNWLALVLLAITLPLVPVFMALIGLTTRRHMDRRWAQLARLSGQFLDLLEGLTSLKIYGKSRGQVAAIEEGTERLRRQTMGTLRVAFASGLVLDLLATLSVALVAVTIGLRLDSGKVGLASALTVLILAPEVFAPIRAVGAQHHATEEGRTVIGTVLDLMGRASGRPVLGDRGRPVPVRPGPDGVVIRLQGIRISYPGRSQPALRDVDLDIRGPGLTVLTGSSGAGKTTLLSVVAGQLDPGVGRMLVGASGQARPDGPAWWDAVAWLPQRPRLSCLDVAGEIRMGDPDLDPAGVDRIVRRCSAPSPSTPLGEDGQAISAGQRRRVALGRATARAERIARSGSLPIVVLDEPTEDLDPATSVVALSLIQDLAAHAAVVIATHDPDVVALADTVVEVVGGGVLPVATAPCQARPGSSAEPAIEAAAMGPGQPDGSPEATSAPAGGRTVGPLVRWVWQSLLQAPRARRSLIWAAGLGSLAGISGLALTATSVWLICRAAQHPNVQALAVAVVGVRTFAISKALLRYGERLAAHDGALRLLAALRVRIFGALEPLAPAGLGAYRRGDLLRRFTADVDGAQEALVRAAVPMSAALATAVAAVALCAVFVPLSALVLGIGALAGGVVLPALTRVGAGHSRSVASAAGDRDAMANGLVDSLDELAAYGGVEDRLAAIAAADGRARAAARRVIRAAAAGTALGGAVAAATMAAVLAAGIAAVSAGSLAAVDLGVLAAAVLATFEVLAALPAGFAALTRAAAGLSRVEEVLGRPVPVPEPLSCPEAPGLGATLMGRSLRLAPAPGAPDILLGGELVLAAGERLAVVGPSGAGKSTLLAAAMGLLSPSSGRVELADDRASVSVTGLPAEARSRLVAGSLQGDHVFATTLRDNLRVVAPTATDSDLDEVAARTGLLAFVASLPDGWSTQAGPDGSNLSGGQRQRLLLARALLADPQILVLDEPTAHLDSATEAAVMADLMDSTTGRTVLLSTHRRAPLSSCDRVATLQGGRLVNAAPRLAPLAKV